MSTTALFLIWTFAILMLAIIVYVSFRGIKVSPPGVRVVQGLLPIPENLEPLECLPVRPLRILVATDGSPCSDVAVQSVAARGWPAGSEIEVVAVVHTRMPTFPDPELQVEAAHVTALEAERECAPGRVQRAQQCLASSDGASVTGKVLEGNPAEVVLDEAERWQADLIVVGSHGFGPVKRRLLGSVSQAIALHAHCSVEIVRCPRPAA